MLASGQAALEHIMYGTSLQAHDRCYPERFGKRRGPQATLR